MNKVIEVKNIGKKYNINHQRGGYIALRDVISDIFKNPFSFLKRKSKEIMGIDTKEEFWALKNINFEIQKGEVVGIIGHNGAGKSTLLKILSQITPPTEGEIKINGRVGSLLEVGTGFHPELTGRENIFLNGAILGMRKKEIIKKFNEIVEFADIEKFIDTPVKYYSSGMYVKLAFSVAAHMEPDILIIDEVLAVGDAEFQKKCLGKMEDITKKEGRTILFVSHNIEAIRRLCQKTLWIKNGSIVAFEDTNKAVEKYINYCYSEKSGSRKWVNNGNLYTDKLFIPQVFEIKEKNGEEYIHLQAELKDSTEDITIGYALYNEQGDLLYWSYHTDIDDSLKLNKGINNIESKFPSEILNTGTYRLELIGGIHGIRWFFEPGKDNPAIIVNVTKDFSKNKFWNKKRPGILAPTLTWKK